MPNPFLILKVFIIESDEKLKLFFVKSRKNEICQRKTKPKLDEEGNHIFKFLFIYSDSMR